MDIRLNEHAAQFAAAFELTSGQGLQEQENVILRQIDSFCSVEQRFTSGFNHAEFVRRIVSLIPCTVTARNVFIECSPHNR